MLDNRFIEFIVELARALLVDELSGHVRRGLARLFLTRRRHNCRQTIRWIHRRNSKRLLHRLLTEADQDP